MMVIEGTDVPPGKELSAFPLAGCFGHQCCVERAGWYSCVGKGWLYVLDRDVEVCRKG